MRAAIIALAHSCMKLIPIIYLPTSLGDAAKDLTTMLVLIYDNAGALISAETLPPQDTPQSKHYTIKTI